MGLNIGLNIAFNIGLNIGFNKVDQEILGVDKAVRGPVERKLEEYGNLLWSNCCKLDIESLGLFGVFRRRKTHLFGILRPLKHY